MVIGYARLRKFEESLMPQITQLQKYGCEKIYEEKSHKAKNNKLRLFQLLNSLTSTDIFVVCKLSYLAKSKKELFEVIDILNEKQINFVSIQDDINTNRSTEKILLNLLTILTEFEKDIAYERKVSGLRTGRPRGRNGGRPKVDQQKLNQAINLYNAQEMTVTEIQKVTGISRTTLYRELKKSKLSNY